MKNKLNNIIKNAKLMLGLTPIAIAAAVLCLAPSSVSGKPPHGGGSGGGLPYPTASTVSQLIADINYANSVGGAITINLSPGATFNLKSANNTTDGGNGLPVIGGTKALALTIVGNGATIARIAVINRYYIVQNPFRLFDVAPGASLTLDHVTLQGGWVSGSGGAILNQGTLNVINGGTLSGNHANSGGGIYNAGGTVTISDNSVLIGNSGGSYSLGGGICNAGGTVTISNSSLSSNYTFYGGGIYNNNGTVTVNNGTLSGNGARFGGGIYNSDGTVTINGSTLSGNAAEHGDYPWGGGVGGGIYNDDGTVTVENSSSITGNTASVLGADMENLSVLYLDGTSAIGILDGNSATPL